MTIKKENTMKTILHVVRDQEEISRISRQYINMYEGIGVEFESRANYIEIPSHNRRIVFSSIDRIDTIRGYSYTDVIIDEYAEFHLNEENTSILSKHNLIDINEDGSLI